ncbi:MAG TPA: type II secretion system protein N [Steroidobacteraceae bacterium]|nr:type II secretion system protein N [Steroidobacteraceae bacterium]
MRRPLWIALLAIAAFAIIVLTRLPASWVFPRSALFACAGIDGSVWSGSCNGLTVQHVEMGDLTWDVAPLRALTGTLAAHIELAHGAVSARSEVDLGFGGGVTLRNLVADLPLDPARVPRVPPQLRGTVHAELALVRLQHGDLTDLKGRIEAHDLLQRTGHVTPIGSYALSFPGGGGDPVGTLQDLGGPLAVQGTLRLMHGPAYILEGEVAARADAAPELLSDLQFLGSPDATGRRPFSMAGTL